jgi:predicted ATPase
LAQQKDIGTIEDFPPFFCMYAEALTLCRRPEAALAELLAARQLFDGAELKVWAPEVYRCTGELLRLTEASDRGAAEKEFQAGIQAARVQGAHVLELRSAISLARLWKSRGDAERAIELLTLTLGDGNPSGNPEAQEATALLALLSAGASALAGRNE